MVLTRLGEGALGDVVLDRSSRLRFKGRLSSEVVSLAWSRLGTSVVPFVVAMALTNRDQALGVVQH